MIVLKVIGILVLAALVIIGLLASLAVVAGAICARDEEEDHE